MTDEKTLTQKIAGEMWQYAAQNPRTNTFDPIDPYRRSLAGGRVTLYINATGRVYLSAARAGSYLAGKALATIKRDFNVPDTARLERRRVGQNFIVALTWKHATPGKWQPAPISPEAA